MPTITQEPLKPDALKGIEDPRQLLTVFNRLLNETGGILNGGATLANAWRVVCPGVEVITPDEWVPLAPLNGFADASAGPAGAGAFAVRKDPYTRRVEVREVVKRAAGAPPGGTPIANLPAGFGPATYGVRVAHCDAGHGAYDVTMASGSNPAQIRWEVGTPTTQFWFSGGSWEAEDSSIPPWDKPITVRLTDRRVSSSTRVRHVLCFAQTEDNRGGILPTVTFPGAYVQAPSKTGEPFLLTLPRIDGLKPLLRYTLTLWAFLE